MSKRSSYTEAFGFVTANQATYCVSLCLRLLCVEKSGSFAAKVADAGRPVPVRKSIVPPGVETVRHESMSNRRIKALR